MKIIKAFIWFALMIIMAYFFSDFKIEGKTIKQHIDSFLSDNVSDNPLFHAGNNELTRSLKDGGLTHTEDISEKDAKALKKLLERHD